MPTYLIGIMLHEPESFALWNRGIIEDYESNTGLFIEAGSEAEAIEWGEQVGTALLRHLNQDDSLDWKRKYCCYLENPKTTAWKHCLDFFQHVRVGEMPDLNRMTAKAYAQWCAEHPELNAGIYMIDDNPIFRVGEFFRGMLFEFKRWMKNLRQ